MILNRLKIVFIIFAFFSCKSSESQYFNNPDSSNRVKEQPYLSVSKIVDGDTFWVDDGTAKGLKIRFIGIDAPESRRMFNREIGYYGKEAKLFLTELLTNKKVKLVSDVDPLDQYGRTLSYVYLEDGTFVNAELIRNGYAVLMTVPPNIAFSEYFAKLQKEARKNQRGLWGEEYNTPVSFEPFKKMD